MEHVQHPHIKSLKFFFTRFEDYTRTDGTATVLKIWSGKCFDCGAAFEVRTPRNVTSFDQSKSFQTRRCPAHRGRAA
jgi:hypothetical protein